MIRSSHFRRIGGAFSFQRKRPKWSTQLFLALFAFFSWQTNGFSETHIDTLLRNYVDLRFGMMMHFNMDTYYPSEWALGRHSPLVWNPDSLDCGQWARAAKAANMKFGLLTCKHHDGFVIWQSNVTPLVSPAYTIKQSSKPTMDVVQAYCDSFRAYGLLPGLYFSMYDVAQGIGGPGGTNYPTTTWTAAQKAYLLGQITELCTNYGPIPLFCFDGWAWCMGQKNFPMDVVRDTIRKMQPNCVITDHNGLMRGPWGGEDFFMVEEPKKIFCPSGNTYASSQDQTITGSWFYNGSSNLNTLSDIVTTHLNVLEPRYCNYLLNCPPNTHGKLDAAIVSRLTEVGATWIPNAQRARLPTQPPRIENPVVPVSAIGGTNPGNAIDGKMDYGSETDWTGTVGGTITLDLGSAVSNIGAFGYLPSQAGAYTTTSTAGEITTHTIAVSTDNSTWTTVVNNGAWAATNNPKVDTFPPSTARYVRLTIGAVNSGTPTASEFGVGTRPGPTTISDNTSMQVKQSLSSGQLARKFIGKRIDIPNEFIGKTVSVQIYTTSGKLISHDRINASGTGHIEEKGLRSEGSYIVRFNIVR
jgi:alpha-L-fucosidase